MSEDARVPYTTAGIIPAVNDLLAGVVILAVYLVRVGTVVEGRPVPLALSVTTDLLLPLLAAVWILALPTYYVVENVRQRR